MDDAPQARRRDDANRLAAARLAETRACACPAGCRRGRSRNLVVVDTDLPTATAQTEDRVERNRPSWRALRALKTFCTFPRFTT